MSDGADAGQTAATAGTAAYPEDLRALAERYLESLRFSSEPATVRLDEAMRYSLLAGGKRIRPVLALASARALGSETRDVLPTAAAIELVHTYSLIHDDLPAMDDDELRRGRPTCHIAYGENVAILAGDGLFAEAYRLVLEHQQGAPERVLSALRRFSEELGVLFQIVDDILDVTGSEKDTGKSHGSDERLGKRTYVSVHGLERARELARDSHVRTRDALAAASETLSGDASALEQVADFVYTRES